MIKEEIVINVNTESAQANVKKLDTGIKGVGTTSDNVSKSGGGAFNKIGDSVRGMFPALDGAMSGLNGVGKSMWAIAANPLGIVLVAIVGTMALLVGVFKSFQPLVDKVEQSMAALGAVLNVIKGVFFDVITGTKSLSQAFGGLGGDMSEATRRTMALVKAQQDLEDVLASQEVQTSRNRAEINKLNVQAKNRSLSEEERLKLLNKASDLEQKDFNQRVKNANEQVRQAREAIAIKAKFSKAEIQMLKEQGLGAKELAESKNGNYDEEFKKLAEAQKNRISLEDESTANLEKNQNKKDKLEDDLQAKRDKASSDREAQNEKNQKRNEENQKAEADRLKSISDFEKNLLKSNQDLNDRTEQEKLDRQKDRDILALENLKATEEEKKNSILLINEKYATLQFDLDTKIALDKKTKDEKDAADKKTKDEKEIADAKKLADEKIAIEKQVGDARKSIQDSQINNVSAGINLLAQLAGKNKSIQKAALVAESAIGIAKIIINTKAANAAAKLKYALLPGGIALASAESLANNISAGIGIAGNILATSKGLSALGGGGGSANAGQDGGRDSSPAAPSFNLVQGTGSNQVAQSLNKQQQPIKAFVVSTDVTTNQAYDRNIVNNSKIG